MREYIPYLSFLVWVTSLRLIFFKFSPYTCKFYDAIVSIFYFIEAEEWTQGPTLARQVLYHWAKSPDQMSLF